MASPDRTDPIGAVLATALRLGGRALEAGDEDGCFEVLACAARLLVAAQNVPAATKDQLSAALAEADGADDRAAALREAFDDLTAGAAFDDPPPPDDPLRAIQMNIGMAISIGAPAYNAGDRRGCYEVYAATARMLLETVEGADAAQDQLRGALRECQKLDDTDDQAWAMRRAFDRIGQMTPTEPAMGMEEVRLFLAMAIRIGAPAFNAGDHRGCYDVYACTARLLIPRIGDDDESTRQTLTDALTEAAIIPSVTRQAWVMREAFDSILDAGGDGDS